MEYDSAVKRDGPLLHLTAWMNLTGIIPSKKDKSTCCDSIKEKAKNRQNQSIAVEISTVLEGDVRFDLKESKRNFWEWRKCSVP